ncbi:MAG: hypothetical protein ACYDH6_03180 [Acidimicrobiales bacterium]
MENAPPAADVPTKDQALAVRPRLDDPTRLMNGDLHPRYVEWMARYPYADRHPFSEFLHEEERLDHLVDDHGYFDRKKVKHALGPSGPKMWVVDGPLPTKAKIPLLAQLLGVSTDELTAVVGHERDMRKKYEAMLGACRGMPYKLLTYEQTLAGVPCPGCGHPWIGPYDELDTDEPRWNEEHGDCHAGGHRLVGGRLHCLRCCGYPAVDPEVQAKVLGILVEAAERAERERSVEASRSPEAKKEQAEKDALRRAKRIKTLEAELAKLRTEEHR